MRKLSILGATGSIGQSTLSIVEAQPDKFEIAALTANTKAKELAALTIKFNAKFAAIADESAYEELKEHLSGTDVKTACGAEGVLEASNIQCDITMAAILGMAGLKPTMAAITQGNTVAFASKEALVGAGNLMMDRVKKSGTTFLPVDSEHNAIYQVFEGKTGVKGLVLTASGGPFLNWSKTDIEQATPEQAVAHPNWSMGAKISVDSASLMNKGLELIEACHLFDMPESQVDVIVHPQSIIHSMVEYIDGSVLAQMGAPDMRTPISYCLGYPERIKTPGETLDIGQMSNLTFEKPDTDKFPCLDLARQAFKAGQGACIVLNGANEIAVSAFLDKTIGFGDIVRINEAVLGKLQVNNPTSLEEVIEIDAQTRIFVQDLLKNNSFQALRA